MTRNRHLIKINKALTLLILISIFFLTNTNLNVVNQAQAVTNLLKGGDFEGDVHLNWDVWSAGKNIDYFRSYETALNQGSYSAGIEMKDGSGDKFSAGITGNGKNVIKIDSSKKYFLQFYAKASQNTNISFYLQDATTFTPVSVVVDQDISNSWNKYMVMLAPISSSTAILNSDLAIAVGNLPAGTILNLDSLILFDSNLTLSTTEVKGFIGDKNKSIRFNTALPFTENEVEIEVPYFYGETGSVGVKRIQPTSISSNIAFFDLIEGSFAGVGTVYIHGNVIGRFTYNIGVKINEFFPSMIRADEDLTINGSGFSPIDATTFIIVKVIDAKNITSDFWIKPAFIDSKLKYITAKMPAGLVGGDLSVVTNFKGTADRNIQNKSNRLRYQVLPVIFYTEWANRGYEQVGDNIKIFGLGISQNPTVNFYNEAGQKTASKKAKLNSIDRATTSIEVIEVATPVNPNKLNITVTVNQVESDKTQALIYSAKPKITGIQTKNSRVMQDSEEKVPAAKIGEEITLIGQGFLNPSVVTYVEFQRLSERMKFTATSSDITSDGRQLKIVVPPGIQTGFVNVEINSEKSNFLPLEIIPTIVDYWPNPVVPGFPLTINTTGVGNNLNLTKIYFKLDNNEEVMLVPDSLETFEANTFVHVTAPLALSSSYSKINVQYDKWRDDSLPVLNVLPHITDASINPDDKILVIKGYGFSIVLNENIVNYKLADAAMTPVSPKNKILGVYPTEEGQELRIQILENYFYGNVSVKVGANTSNEVNFGPVLIRKITRRVEFVRSLSRVMGVLYINGYNFGSNGDVKVGEVWAQTHYRSNYFIIAVVEQQDLNGNPVIVTKQ